MMVEALLVAPADDLEEEVGGSRVARHVPEFVEDEDIDVWCSA